MTATAMSRTGSGRVQPSICERALLLRRPRCFLLFDHELVVHGERAGDFTCAHAGDGFVALAVDDTHQDGSTAFHDNVNREIAERLHTGEPAPNAAVKSGAE